MCKKLYDGEIDNEAYERQVIAQYKLQREIRKVAKKERKAANRLRNESFFDYAGAAQYDERRYTMFVGDVVYYMDGHNRERSIVCGIRATPEGIVYDLRHGVSRMFHQLVHEDSATVKTLIKAAKPPKNESDV